MHPYSIFLFLLYLTGSPVAAQGPHSASDKIKQTTTASAPYARAFSAGRDIVVNLGESDLHKLDVVGSKVAITNAYLIPSPNFLDDTFGDPSNKIPNQFRNAAFLCVEVANISSQPLLVTAMKLDVINPQKLGFGPGMLLGSCSAEKVSDVSPECLLQPGQRKKWVLQKGIVIPGVADFVKRQTDEYLIDVERPKRTNNDEVIRRFNNFLRSAVGAKTTLRVRIFELNYKPVLTGHFQLTKGKDMFASEPVVQQIGGKKTLVFPLQHDAFLGEALSQLTDEGDMRQRSTLLSCRNRPTE